MRTKSIVFASLLISLPASSAWAEDLEDQDHLFEAGVFAGVMLPSDSHELIDPVLPKERHQQLYNALLDLGLRLGYLPIPYLGIEAEAAFIPAVTADYDGLVYSLRAHLLGQYPIGRFAPFLVAGGGALGIDSGSAELGKNVDGLGYWGLGAKYYALDWLALRADFRHDITAGNHQVTGDLTSHFEILGGVTGVFGWSGDSAPPSDRDGDGIVDDDDKCPDEPGVEPDGCPASKDSDGDGLVDSEDSCPNQPAKTPDGCPLKDEDGDGVTDDKDKCLGRPGVAPDGCPPDSDGDGVLDDKDRCPKVPAKTEDGCPVRDTDGDGIFDDKDKCIDQPETKNGFEDADGCPDKVPDSVKKFMGDIKGITFETDSDKIRPQSFKVLDEAVKVLKEFPKVKVLIKGHTDNVGRHDHNVNLSTRRAESVKRYLVSKGIDTNRLTTKGLGPDEPAVSNNTKQGRAQNRRIEFVMR